MLVLMVLLLLIVAVVVVLMAIAVCSAVWCVLTLLSTSWTLAQWTLYTGGDQTHWLTHYTQTHWLTHYTQRHWHTTHRHTDTHTLRHSQKLFPCGNHEQYMLPSTSSSPSSPLNLGSWRSVKEPSRYADNVSEMVMVMVMLMVTVMVMSVTRYLRLWHINRPLYRCHTSHAT